MAYTLEEIKKDIITLNANQIYKKYIFDPAIWYFENNKEGFELMKIAISENMKIDPNDITIVGSAKIGYSLSPIKNFKHFNDDSDIDVVIVSKKWFQYFWKLYRKSYRPEYNFLYKKNIYRETFLGFIHEENMDFISGCRKSWRDLTADTKKYLSSVLFLKHKMNIRLYRNWQDFEDYNIWSINKLKGEILNAV